MRQAHAKFAGLAGDNLAGGYFLWALFTCMLLLAAAFITQYVGPSAKGKLQVLSRLTLQGLESLK